MKKSNKGNLKVGGKRLKFHQAAPLKANDINPGTFSVLKRQNLQSCYISKFQLNTGALSIFELTKAILEMYDQDLLYHLKCMHCTKPDNMVGRS